MDNESFLFICIGIILFTIVICGVVVASVSIEETSLSIDLPIINQGDALTVTLSDSNGQPLANKTVHITINGVTYNQTTDDAGKTQLPINLAIDDYYVGVKFDGEPFKYKSSGITQPLKVQNEPEEVQITTTSTSTSSSGGDILVWTNEYGDKVYQKPDGSVYGIGNNGDWFGSGPDLDTFIRGPD